MHYIAFDTETTGLQAGSRIIELGAMKMDETGKVVDRFCQLINPEMPLPQDALSVNRIDPADLKNAPTAGDALTDFLAWMGDTAFGIAHFAQYDMGVMSWELDRANIPHPALPVVCTWKMAKRLGKTRNNKLVTLAEHYNLKTSEGDAHRALADVDICRQYYDIASQEMKPIMTPWTADYGYSAHLPEAFSCLRGAIESGSRVRFAYVDKSGAKTHREITPYGFAMMQQGFYMHGMCHMRNERREFKLDQVSEFAVL